MKKKLNTRIALVSIFALTAVAFSVTPAAAAPASPGACNMLHTSSTGMDGMLKASERGLGNMMALVIASEASGCSL
jgi:Spy/CpxP family protein refolding chaperone